MYTRFVTAILALLLWSACVKDTIVSTYTYTIATPVYRTAAEVRQAIGNKAPQPVRHPGKLYVQGSYIFLNEKGKGIHIIDNENPARPRVVAFVHIPGCEDLAVFGNILYADCFTDMMVLDISNPDAVQLKDYIPNMFPDRQFIYGYYVDSGRVITDWVLRDTTVTTRRQLGGPVYENGVFWGNTASDFSGRLTTAGAGSGNGSTGRGGSMARFAIAANHLYTVTTHKLHTLSLATPARPVWKRTVDLPWGIETVYPFQDRLFIGANTGMHIYSISNPAAPVHAGTFAHARVCDPVIGDEAYAYVTLRSDGNLCGGFINQMDVVDVRQITAPKLVQSVPLTNPHGLDKAGDLVYVCDGKDGLKVLDAHNPRQVKLLRKFDLPDAWDIICQHGVAIVSAAGGLYQLDISNWQQIKTLSILSIEK